MNSTTPPGAAAGGGGDLRGVRGAPRRPEGQGEALKEPVHEPRERLPHGPPAQPGGSTCRLGHLVIRALYRESDIKGTNVHSVNPSFQPGVSNQKPV